MVLPLQSTLVWVTNGCVGVLKQLCGELGVGGRKREAVVGDALLRPDTGLLLELQSDILITISCLCEADLLRKVSVSSFVSSAHSLSVCVCLLLLLISQELFSGLDGVKLLTGYLQSANRSLLDSGLGYHRLMLSVTDCVWCTVVGNPLVEDIFLEEGGVFCLLDLLQV